MSSDPGTSPAVHEPEPGLRVVRIASWQPLENDAEHRFQASWNALLRDVNRGHLILLDFRDVSLLSSLFLVSLLQAHRELTRRGACFVSFGIEPHLERMLRVTGLSLSLETVLHHAPTEADALARARAFRDRYSRPGNTGPLPSNPA